MDEDSHFTATGTVWRWQSGTAPAAWFFMTIDGQTSAEIRYATLGRKGGFGSIKVVARIGSTVWNTSLFPSKQAGGYMLPLKAEVRKREAISEGDDITVGLEV